MAAGRIVVGVDGSEGSAHAVAWCGEYGSQLGFEVVAVHVVPPPAYVGLIPGGPHLIDDPALREKLLSIVRDEWCRPLRDAGAKYDGLVVEGNEPWMLIDVAEREDADMIVAGTRGRGGFADLLLGSATHQLAHHTRRPLAIVPPPRTTRSAIATRRILAGVDGSEGSDHALAWSIDLAKALDAEIVAVHVLELPWHPLNLTSAAEVSDPQPLHTEFVTEWCRPLRDAKVRHRTILAEGSPAPSLLGVAEREDPDLLVIGSRGRGGAALAELKLGSVGHKLAHHAGRPLVIVPRSNAL